MSRARMAAQRAVCWSTDRQSTAAREILYGDEVRFGIGVSVGVRSGGVAGASKLSSRVGDERGEERGALYELPADL
jgi:hypothetical protein